jgi:hypothetical protein
MFQTTGPEAPDKVWVDESPGDGALVLRWHAVAGRDRAIKFEVHASNIEGFSIGSDTYLQTVKDNLLIIGERVALAPKAFYRVVAIDRMGNRSAPSELAAAPRPFVWSRPPLFVKLGQRYQYRPAAVASLGAIRIYNGQTPAYADTDLPEWEIVNAPSWLAFEQGILHGQTSISGDYPVHLRVRTRTSGSADQAFVLRVGKTGSSQGRNLTVAGPTIPTEARDVIERFYRGAGNLIPVQEFMELIAPEFLARISRIDSSFSYVERGVRDMQLRLNEYGPVTSVQIDPIVINAERADVFVKLRYREGRQFIIDRLTVVKMVDGSWRIGRAK